MEKTTQFLFQPRKARMARFGKYAGKPVEVLLARTDGTMMVTCVGETWNPFTAHSGELTPLRKPIHGSPDNYTFNNDGSLRTRE